MLDMICLIRYGCYKLDQLEPIGNPMICQKEKYRMHIRTIECCRYPDYCNADLNPTLGPVILHPGSNLASVAVKLTANYSSAFSLHVITATSSVLSMHSFSPLLSLE